MARPVRLPSAVLAAIRDNKYFGVKAGDGPHRFIGIWAVVVGNRAFARSWTMKAGGWHRTMAAEGGGRVQAGSHELRVRARIVRSERLKDAVTRAYFEKYDTPSALKYCRGFARGRRRDSTIEFLPVTPRRVRRSR